MRGLAKSVILMSDRDRSLVFRYGEREEVLIFSPGRNPGSVEILDLCVLLEILCDSYEGDPLSP